ncbi:MAG: metal ABC transporter ATP-binding protein [Candidatus Goldbacteria bacterium]|nr:metal ABC transporter ATP-binding protein [Candidatus Goldiibacteriota bacterium]
MNEIISFYDVTVKIGQKTILSNIDFKLNRGDFILLIGANGSGKTTLLKTALGFIKPSFGSIIYKNEISGYKDIKNFCGYVPQRLDIDRYFPVIAEDVINFAKPEKNLLNYIIKEFRIKDIIRKPFGMLSGGERQKILLAMALSKKPDILLLDEPNLNLDINAYRDFLRCLLLIKKEFNPTILMVTHLISIIPKMVNRVFVIKDGRIIYKKAPYEIFKIKNIMEIIYG